MRVHRLLAAVGLLLGLATVASAQAKAMGSVRDLSGHAIKGATVRALNPDAYPGEFTSATDDKGRFAMIGLKTGTWRFVAEAPGYYKFEASVPIRMSSSAPMVFTLGRDPGPIPNALDRNIAQELQEAATARTAGRLDQALSSYQDIRSRNPKLTAINLVIADIYRTKAQQATDATARQALLQQALDAYDLMLKSDATNARALTESAAVRAAVGARNQ